MFIIMLLHLAALTATVLVLSRALPSIHVQNTGSAIAVAVVFSLLNFFLGWIVRVVLFVPALLTFGLLFFFVPLIVNAFVLWLTDKVLASFEIKNVRTLWLMAFILTVVNWLFTASYRYVPGGNGHPASF